PFIDPLPVEGEVFFLTFPFIDPLPVEGEVFFLTFPFIDQAITRFDRWSMSAMAMLRHRSSRGIKRSRNGPRRKQGLEVSNARNTKSAAAHSQLRMLFSKSKVKR